MKTPASVLIFLLLLPLALVFTGCETTSGGGSGEAKSSSELPEVTHDGLVRIPNTRAGAVWELPEADFSGYTKFALAEPEVSFRKNWQSDINYGRSPLERISSSQMDRMIAFGKELLAETFTEELQKGGFEVVDTTGPDVLIIRPVILNLDIRAPDPNNTAGMWTQTHTDGAGSMTLVLELYDSMTKQILLRATDTKSDRYGGASDWAFQRTQQTNINDARAGFSEWARMLVKGWNEARQAAEAN